jgi:hypothetical protein
MQFPGTNKLQLSDDALRTALEGAINATRRDGEDYVYVTEVGRTGYGYGDWLVTITTDRVPATISVIGDAVCAEAA